MVSYRLLLLDGILLLLLLLLCLLLFLLLLCIDFHAANCHTTPHYCISSTLLPHLYTFIMVLQTSHSVPGITVPNVNATLVAPLLLADRHGRGPSDPYTVLLSF